MTLPNMLPSAKFNQLVSFKKRNNLATLKENCFLRFRFFPFISTTEILQSSPETNQDFNFKFTEVSEIQNFMANFCSILKTWQSMMAIASSKASPIFKGVSLHQAGGKILSCRIRSSPLLAYDNRAVMCFRMKYETEVKTNHAFRTLKGEV